MIVENTVKERISMQNLAFKIISIIIKVQIEKIIGEKHDLNHSLV